MIKITKRDLNFLSVFESCADSKTQLGDKLQIKASKEKNAIIFSQFGEDVNLITKVDKAVEEDFKVVFTTTEFFSLIKLIDDEVEVTITSSGIEFNKNKYDITNHSFEIGDSDHYLSIIETGKPETTTFTHLSQIASVKNYMGQTDTIDCISYQNRHFVACDPTLYSGFIKTNNSIEGISFFSKKAITLFTQLKLSNVEINTFSDNGFYYFKSGNTFILIPIKEYNIPDLFSENIACIYNHKDKAVVVTDAFKKALSRMKVACAKVIEGRTLFTFEEKSIKLELKEKNAGYAFELVSADVDNNLVGFSFYTSANNLSNMINEFSGKEISIYSPVNSEGSVIKLEDETKDKFYVLNLLDF